MVRFTIEQVFPRPVDEVIAALLEPAFLECIGDLPNLAPPQLLDQQRTGHTVVQRIRYRFTGSLSPAVSRVIDPSKVTWVNETTFDLGARRASFQIIPDHYVHKLRCSGTYVFTQRDPQTTTRCIEGELTVGVPLVGKIVERAIFSGLEEHLNAEAALLLEWLEPSG